MNRELWDRWCERGILALVLCILIFGPLATGAVRAREFVVLQGLTLGVMALWVARLWLNQRFKLLWPPVCWAAVAFALYAIGRYLTADIEYIARQELVHILVYTFLFLAILNNLHRQESTQLISLTLIFLAMGISFYAIYQFATGSNKVWGYVVGEAHRGSGTYISANHLGGFLEMLLPLGLACTLAGRFKPLTRILLGYASLVMLAGIAVTLSRGTWISTALALALFFFVLAWHRTYRLPAVVMLAALLLGGYLCLPRSYSVQLRFRQLMAEVDQNAGGVSRYALWGPALQIWQDHFWWGAGPAHYDYRFRAYRPEAVQLRPEKAHNDYLQTLADWGLVGMALVTSALALLGYAALKTWRAVWGGGAGTLGGKSSSNKFAFVAGASFGLIAILFHSVVDFNMRIPANAILAISLMALLSGYVRFATDRYWFSAGPWTKALATLLLLAGVGWLAPQGWRSAREYAWWERAAWAPQFSPEQAECLTQALAVDPMNPDTTYELGEVYRVQSSSGVDNYRELAAKAIAAYERGARLNPWNGYNYLRHGMCLDWLDRTTESGPYFDRAEQLDPNGYFTLANIGMHYVSLGNYAAAKPWFERSLRLEPKDNQFAENYLRLATLRLLEAATNEISAPLPGPAGQ